MKKYYPILLSKAGELQALSKLTDDNKSVISPVLQILKGDHSKVFKLLSESFIGSGEIYLDFSTSEDSPIDEAEHLISSLQILGVTTIPVIQLNSPNEYYDLYLKLLREEIIDAVCIRLSNDSGGFSKINDRIQVICTKLSIEQSNVTLLLDFGFLTKDNYRVLTDFALSILSTIDHLDKYRTTIVASGSFPKDLTDFKYSEAPHFQSRYEWFMWKEIGDNSPNADVLSYGDYGTKHPFYDPSTAQYPGTCSIRYTLEDKFLVYKGKKSNHHELGNGQYIFFANKLVDSGYFYGEELSWGDEQIAIYAAKALTGDKIQPGGGQRWVEITQNHHISLLTSLL